MWNCKLCDLQDLPSAEALLTHLNAIHSLTESQYLRAIQAPSLVPEEILAEGELPDPNQPTPEELTLLRGFVDEGLNPGDERLRRVCFILATLKRKEADFRGMPAASINPRDLSDLRSLYKEARDTLSEMRREQRSEDADQEGENLLQVALADAEKYVKANQGDFQFRCGHCGTWVQTDGLPVWMLLQDQDPKDPSRRRVHVGNGEILWLVQMGSLPLSLAAFILRTSPEGLRWTAEQRGLDLYPQDPPGEREEMWLQRLVTSEAEVRDVRQAFDDAQDVAEKTLSGLVPDTFTRRLSVPELPAPTQPGDMPRDVVPGLFDFLGLADLQDSSNGKDEEN
jgi:hypothetical protein